jgi:6-phosphogluconolactonase
VTRLTTCADAEAVAVRAARDIARHCERVRAERGVVNIALSGGTTPRRAYELLASEPLGWSAVAVWFADERCVGPDDEESNYKLASDTLLGTVDIPPAQIHRMEGELGPAEGSQRYALELSQHAPPGAGELPALDLIVLGIGPDGHVASLFPGAGTLDAGEEAVCLGVHDSPKPPPERITLSLPVLRAAATCMLLATGPSKADAVAAMLAEPSRHVPASLLRRERLTVIVDDAASPGRA